MAVDILKPNDCNDNAGKNVILDNDKNNNFNDHHGLPELLPYQKLIKELTEDERCCKELQLGRRIGFYKIRGDLGSGNFAQVKLSYHCLTKGLLICNLTDNFYLIYKKNKYSNNNKDSNLRCLYTKQMFM